MLSRAAWAATVQSAMPISHAQGSWVLFTVVFVTACTHDGKASAIAAVSDSCPEGMIHNTGKLAPFCASPHESGLEQPCSQDANCAVGLRCNIGFERGKCLPPESAAEGQTCGVPSDCRRPLMCRGGRARDGVGGVCRK